MINCCVGANAHSLPLSNGLLFHRCLAPFLALAPSSLKISAMNGAHDHGDDHHHQLSRRNHGHLSRDGEQQLVHQGRL